MHRRFVLVSGLPASGKSRLAARLAGSLHLPLIDKDDILDRLFASRGVGDDIWRRTLSRESDAILQAEAEASDGAILVSFWRLPGMRADSGTPIEWLGNLSNALIHVQCVCDVATAASRFTARSRHPGHLDQERTRAEIIDSLQEIADLGPLGLGTRIDVDTSGAVDLEPVVAEINRAWTRT